MLPSRFFSVCVPAYLLILFSSFLSSFLLSFSSLQGSRRSSSFAASSGKSFVGGFFGQLAKELVGIRALGQHIAALPQKILIYQADGTAQRLHQAVQAVLLCAFGQLERCLFLFCLVFLPGRILPAATTASFFCWGGYSTGTMEMAALGQRPHSCRSQCISSHQ